MRIISDFRDYYDSMQGMGQDQTLIFNRTALFLPRRFLCWDKMTEKEKDLFNLFSGHYSRVYIPDNLDVGTCGFVSVIDKVFPFMVSKDPLAMYGEDPMKYLQKVYWAQEQIQKDKDLSQNIKDFWTKKSSTIDRFWNTKSDRYLFEKQQKYGVPIIRLWNYGEVDMNPQLHKMGFERFMSPPEIYQEISMFLGGLTAPEKEIVTISDKDKIVEHGFDKWSFRKMPGEKKRRKDKREIAK